MPTFQALSLSNFFSDNCDVNIGCIPHVVYSNFFIKIYSSIWLSQNFFMSILFNTVTHKFHMFFHDISVQIKFTIPFYTKLCKNWVFFER
jgi:hypothetical protein